VEDDHPDERWMASYMDMVTVLMCMFIVLFAMSTVDQKKYEQLRNSLATGFGAEEVGLIDTAEGTVVPPELVNDESESFSEAELALAEVDELYALREAIRRNLHQNGVDQLVQIKIDDRGLTVGLVGSETFFAPDRAELSVAAVRVLDAIAPVLAESGREVSAEGHADRHGRTVNFPTDWELSSGRATQVLRRLVEHGGVPQERIKAVGFGAARPIATGSALEDMAMNRRVDVIVQSDESDIVRQLIPGIVAGEGAVSPASRGSKLP
jgi:chemotaxis protein MotB